MFNGSQNNQPKCWTPSGKLLTAIEEATSRVLAAVLVPVFHEGYDRFSEFTEKIR